MSTLIPKHLTPANPLGLQNDNTLVIQPVVMRWDGTFIQLSKELLINK